MLSEEEVVKLLQEQGLENNRYLFGVYALNHVYRLLQDAGEITGDQAAELTILIVNQVLNDKSGPLQEIEV